MSNICKNTIEITGNKNNLKKIEDILNQKRKKSKIKFFNEFCEDTIPKYNFDFIEDRKIYEIAIFGAEDIKFSEVKYTINDNSIEIKFKTSFYAPLQFINQLALDYNVCVKSTFIGDYYHGNQTFTIDFDEIKKALGINSDETEFVDKIKTPITKPLVKTDKELLNYMNNNSCILDDSTLNIKNISEDENLNMERLITSLMITSILQKYTDVYDNKAA